MISIRKAIPNDRSSIWKILQAINKRGDSFSFLPETSEEEMMNYWMASDKYVYVACNEKDVFGSFYLRNNQPGLGDHIANAAYAVAENNGGKGIGKLMGKFSLQEAKRLGYKAMQFNLVVKTNTKAVALWKSIGFEIIGEIPEAFRHKELGLVNAYIMHQKLK